MRLFRLEIKRILKSRRTLILLAIALFAFRSHGIPAYFI